MKTTFTLCLTFLSLFSWSQNNSNNTELAALTCTVTLIGTTNPTASGLCDGTATISLAACSNPPYQIQWINSNGSASCQMLPPAESAFTGATYAVNTLCGCPSDYYVVISNSLGEQVVVQVAITNPAATSLSELYDNTYISITPNPAQEILTMDYKINDNVGVTMDVTNACGQIVLSSGIVNGIQRIDIQHLPNGIYFVKIYSNHKQIGFRKIVVHK